MSLNSVHTNTGAQVALQFLNRTEAQLQATEKRVSTGYRVAGAEDDGGAFAVAQTIRSDANALDAADRQLGNAKGLISTTLAALTALSSSLIAAKGLLVKIADPAASQAQRDQYDADYKGLVRQVADTVDHGGYAGQTLLGTVAGALAGSALDVVSDGSGAVVTLTGQDASGLPNELAALIGSSFNRTVAGVDSFGVIAPGGDQAAAFTALTVTFGVPSFALLQSGIDNQVGLAGAQSKSIDATLLANQGKIDSLNAGLGALVDSDLGHDSVALQSLQIRRQLATQALSLENQAPQTILALFKQ